MLNQPSLSIAFAGQVRRAVIAAHHVAAPHVQLADRPLRNEGTLAIDNPGLDARQQMANRLIGP